MKFEVRDYDTFSSDDKLGVLWLRLDSRMFMS